MPSAVTSVLITGANSGIGRELARQLGERPEITRVYLGCRDRGRAEAARSDLTASTGRDVFSILTLDTSSPESVRNAVTKLPAPVDALVMNAGSAGPTPDKLTPDGVTSLFATFVLGHVALFDELVAQRKLTGVAVLAGSEAARGVKKLGMKRPDFGDNSVAELSSVMDGSYYRTHKFNVNAAYGQVKYLAALWMGSAARQHPDLRIVTMSPGGTYGTGVSNSMSAVQGFIYDRIMMGGLLRIFGVTHDIPTGAARLRDAVTDPKYASGEFYASHASTVSGPVINQSTISPDLASPGYQDNANAAIHHFLKENAADYTIVR